VEIREEAVYRVSLEISTKRKTFEWKKVQSVNKNISNIEKEEEK